MPVQSDNELLASFLKAVEGSMTSSEFRKQSGASLSLIRKLENRTGKQLRRIRSYGSGHSSKTDIDWIFVLQDAQARGISVNKLAAELFVTTGAVLSAEDRTGIYLTRKRPNPTRVVGFRNQE